MSEQNPAQFFDQGDFIGADDDSTATARYVAGLVAAARGGTLPTPSPAEAEAKPSSIVSRIVEPIRSLFKSDESTTSAPVVRDSLDPEPDALAPGTRWGVRVALGTGNEGGAAVQVVTAPSGPTAGGVLADYGRDLAHPALTTVEMLRGLYRVARAKRDRLAAEARQAAKELANLRAAATAGGLARAFELMGAPEPELPSFNRVRVSGLKPFLRHVQQPADARIEWHRLVNGRHYEAPSLRVECLGIGHTFDAPDINGLVDELVASGLVERAPAGAERRIPDWQRGNIRREFDRPQSS